MINANPAIVVFVKPAIDLHLVSDLEINSAAIGMLGATTRTRDAGSAALGRNDGNLAKFLANLREALLDN